jgi:MerR family copper efflux transcriptional regulator
MNIGQAARASGVSAKMIRHYEATGLIQKAGRTQSGYRSYQEQDVHLLRFVRRARSAGFDTPQIRKLLALWRDRDRPAREVKKLAAAHLADLQVRIAELQAIAGTLADLVDHCRGDERPHCPILDSLASQEPARMPKSRRARAVPRPRGSRSSSS